MSRIDELLLNARNGDMCARELLIQENAGLIWSVVKRFIGRGVETEDLYQLGCLGFLKAIDGFSKEFGTQFSTYAVPKIAGEIRRFLRDDGTLKVSRSIKEQATTVKVTRNKLSHEFGREPTVQEISAQTGLSIEQIATAETATASIESINQETGTDGFSLEQVLSNSDEEGAMIERIALQCAMRKLPHRESLVINLRYYHALTQDRIARILGISQVQVSRIEKKALVKLRDMMQ